MDPQLALGQFLTLTGGAALIVALVEVVKRTLAWSDALTQRFAPLTSLIVGVVLFCVVAALTTTDIGQSAFGGVVAGLYACGLYNIAGQSVITAVAGVPKGGG